MPHRGLPWAPGHVSGASGALKFIEFGDPDAQSTPHPLQSHLQPLEYEFDRVQIVVLPDKSFLGRQTPADFRTPLMVRCRWVELRCVFVVKPDRVRNELNRICRKCGFTTLNRICRKCGLTSLRLCCKTNAFFNAFQFHIHGSSVDERFGQADSRILTKSRSGA